MAFDPTQFLPIARRLDPGVSGGAGEGEIRTAMGRAYYSAFLVARERLTEAGFTPNPGLSIHQWVLARLKTATDAHLKSLGGQLGSLFGNRKLADYDLGNQMGYSPGAGHRAASISEGWIRAFKTYPLADLKKNVLP
jgi:hypothetical protein